MYDLYVRIARLSESDAAVTPDLQLVSASVKPGSKLVFGSNPYSEWYRFYAATSASSLLQLAKVKESPRSAAAFSEAGTASREFWIFVRRPGGVRHGFRENVKRTHRRTL